MRSRLFDEVDNGAFIFLYVAPLRFDQGTKLRVGLAKRNPAFHRATRASVVGLRSG